MRVAKNKNDVKRLTKFARRISKQGLKVDPIKYEGKLGRYNMVFDGRNYVIELLPNDTCDWEELHSLIISGTNAFKG